MLASRAGGQLRATYTAEASGVIGVGVLEGAAAFDEVMDGAVGDTEAFADGRESEAGLSPGELREGLARGLMGALAE